MGFDIRDIRPSMDVYTLDNAYIGTVLGVVPGETEPGSERVPGKARQSSKTDGEMLGPMPTQQLGNRGPRTQSARALYATPPDGATPVGRGAINVGKWWGLAARRLIPMGEIQSVSLERVVLRRKKEELA